MTSAPSGRYSSASLRCFLVAGGLVHSLLQNCAAEELQFNRDIRPILSEYCFACHGFDAKSRKGDLRLDIAEDAHRVKDGVSAIVPRDVSKSELWKRISSTDADIVMPPRETKKSLSAAQKETLRRWIEEGGTYQKHWAFEAPVAQAVPVTKNSAWGKNPIDRFILAKLESMGFVPQREASKTVLIRRVAFTLTGLPPSLTEVETFLQDDAPNAYDRMVERYLRSPHYGEEMARHWLDVARYADTHGLHLDNDRTMWLYRDWVIASFNRNQPFNDFTVEQIAGDQLPNPTVDQLVATGFNRCNVTTSEGGSIPEEFLYRYAVERTSTVVEAWLGLTGGCAVCHDHKFDPLTMNEFYSLYSFFYSAADPAMDGNITKTAPFLKVPSPEQKEQLAAARSREAELLRRYREIVAAEAYEEPAAGSEKKTVIDVWLRDYFPLGASGLSSSRNEPIWQTNPLEMPPRGRRVLVQESAFNLQDRYDNSAIPLVIPENGVFHAWVKLAPQSPSKAIMLELKGKKVGRAIWGDADKLGAGKIGSPGRLRVGDLPPLNQWIRLEVKAEQLGYQPGDVVQGLALAQYGGLVYWDGVEVTGQIDPAKDQRSSFLTWWKARTGQDTPGITAKLAGVLKNGPDKNPSDEERKSLLRFYQEEIQRDHQEQAARSRREYSEARIDALSIEDSIPGTFIYKDVEQPRQAFVMLRGQYDKPGEKVSPAVPSIFPPLALADPNARPTRLDLAKWLVADSQPTTSRVTVNRFWQQVFGTGLVKTSFDFGSQGDSPSHPELMDWLAVWFRENDWNVKELMRLMVTSATFRQETVTTTDGLNRDPENRYYARGPRYRLDAEQIRDNSLFVSGLMNFTMGGKGVRPYQPANIWEPVGYSDSNTRYYLQDHGDALYRRSIYCYLKRTAPPPFMSNFDGPNREQFCTRRDRTNTPLQALQLMNDVQHVEAARAFADRILEDGGATPAERISFAFRAALSRLPTPEELQVVDQALTSFMQKYQANAAAAEALIHVGESKPRAKNRIELAAYTLLANLILNLDEVTVRN